MPELPDIILYQESLRRFVGGRELVKLIVRGPSFIAQPLVDSIAAEKPALRLRVSERLAYVGARRLRYAWSIFFLGVD